MSRPLRTVATPATLLAVILAVGGGACARHAAPPEPGTSQGTPPDLRGIRVMVLPMQDNRGVRGDVDAELAFGLNERGRGVDWILPAKLQDAVDRAPGLNASLRGLPVGTFEAAEVRRVGDPLYGELRRLAALVDGEVALIPVSAAPRSDSTGAFTVRLATALVQVRTGRVLWFGVVEGDAGPPEDPRALASAVDELARTLLWYVGA